MCAHTSLNMGSESYTFRTTWTVLFKNIARVLFLGGIQKLALLFINRRSPELGNLPLSPHLHLKGNEDRSCTCWVVPCGRDIGPQALLLYAVPPEVQVAAPAHQFCKPPRGLKPCPLPTEGHWDISQWPGDPASPRADAINPAGSCTQNPSFHFKSTSDASSQILPHIILHPQWPEAPCVHCHRVLDVPTEKQVRTEQKHPCSPSTKIQVCLNLDKF